eukprot:6489985-Pyramimonas_sp.AAC.1
MPCALANLARLGGRFARQVGRRRRHGEPPAPSGGKGTSKARPHKDFDKGGRNARLGRKLAAPWQPPATPSADGRAIADPPARLQKEGG